MENKNISFYKTKNLSGKLSADTETIKEIFKKDGMFRSRKFSVGKTIPAALFFFDGMVDSLSLSESIMKPLCSALIDKRAENENILSLIEQNYIFAGELKKTDNLAEMLEGIMYGDTLLLINGYKEAFVINTKGFKIRSVEEPPNERVALGPREGFCESITVNTSLLRRKLQTPDFCTEMICCGRRTGTRIALCYLSSLADSSLVEEVKKRIAKIDIDGVLDTNYISESIRDKNLGIFKTLGTTERPDVVAARLLEGRVALLCDGSPSAITAPFLFSENFQTDDDYYLNFFVGSLGRVLRILSFFIACFFTGIYVSLVTFHAGLLPTNSALAVFRLRAAAPSSTLTESLLLIMAFEVLKEACSKAPHDTVTALGIVGGLVLGDAAVNSDTISAPTLIIVALSGICSIMLPRIRGPIFFINLLSTVSAGLFGLFGVFSVGIFVTLYILNLTSFGIDYTEMLFSPSFQNIKDVLFRASWKNMIIRPPFNKNKRRQK